MADNGFKSGYANALQTMMEAKLPGCGIKATPHITSRLKTLKRLWQTTYDIIYGPNTSGFGWDPETKLVTADDNVWEEYMKTLKPSESTGQHSEGVVEVGGSRIRPTTQMRMTSMQKQQSGKEKLRPKRPGEVNGLARRSKETPVTRKRKNPSDDHAHSSDSSPKEKNKAEDDRKRKGKMVDVSSSGKTKSGSHKHRIVFDSLVTMMKRMSLLIR
ncbi:hypothetical protein K1719_005664 [Acacia pycnantha]|nr:hypothetical protein K1719_005664 [Acacia pycnantha]